MSIASAPALLVAGEHWLSLDDDIEAFFIAALHSAGRGFVRLEQWERFVRQPDGSLEKEWAWHLFLSGDVHGYATGELVLDLAAPLVPGSADADALERRGRLARIIGIGQPAAAPDQSNGNHEAVDLEESKVITLPLSLPSTANPGAGDSPLDPNLFPG